MYNIDFIHQLEKCRKHIFGYSDSRDLPASAKYHPPEGVEIIECVLDTNGEWVPKKALERRVDLLA